MFDGGIRGRRRFSFPKICALTHGGGGNIIEPKKDAKNSVKKEIDRGAGEP